LRDTDKLLRGGVKFLENTDTAVLRGKRSRSDAKHGQDVGEMGESPFK
jgi:hypothetical protein